MANTTNFGWSTPDNTGLVKDGAQDIRTLGSAIDNSMGELLGGTTGQVLAKSSGTDMDFVWTDAAEVDPATPNVAGIVLGDTVNENASYGYKAGENQTASNVANTLIGSYSGRQLTTGVAVTAVGKQAFMNSNASQTVAVGYNTMGGTSVSGGDNVAVGNSAGYNQQGNNNTYMGAGAGAEATTGSNNTVIGGTAQKSTETASNEVTLGNASVTRFRVPGVGLDTSGGTTGQALVKTGANTVGWATAGASPATPTAQGIVYGRTVNDTLGVALGYNAGLNLTEGAFYNTLIGYNAGRALTNKSRNTVIGQNALMNATSDDNIAIGHAAMQSTTTGVENIAIGVVAGNNLNGNNNVYLGQAAGVYDTTGNNNIVIGSTTDKSAPTVSNEVTIGNASITRFRVPGVGLDTSGGTTGQVLAKTGSNTVGWVTPGGGGATLISSTVFDGTSRSYVFSSIPQTYDSLRIIWQGAAGALDESNPRIQINGYGPDPQYTTSTFHSTTNGAPMSSYYYIGQDGYYFCDTMPRAARTIEASNVIVIDIPAYTLTNTIKTFSSSAYFRGEAPYVDKISTTTGFFGYPTNVFRIDLTGGSGGGNFLGTFSIYGIN